MVQRLYLDKLLYSPLEFTHYQRALRLKGYQIVDQPQAADLIISSYLSMLKKHLKLNKRYLLWSHEPYHNWSGQSLIKVSANNVPSKFRRKTLSTIKSSVPIHIMNCYTGDVYTHNLRYFYFTQSLTPQTLQSLTVLKKLKTTTNPTTNPIWPQSPITPLVVLSTKYPTNYYSNNPFTLLPERYTIIEWGHQQKLLDLYGQNWENNMAKGESRRDPDRRISKSLTLSPYLFNLCLESACAPYYVTEKIWEAISNYCLPIYYSNSTIYQLFPRDSFIDYRQFASPQNLFEYLQKMTPEQYLNRLNKCITTFNRMVNFRQKHPIPKGDSSNNNINYLEYLSCYQQLEQKIKKILGSQNSTKKIQKKLPQKSKKKSQKNSHKRVRSLRKTATKRTRTRVTKRPTTHSTRRTTITTKRRSTRIIRSRQTRDFSQGTKSFSTTKKTKTKRPTNRFVNSRKTTTNNNNNNNKPKKRRLRTYKPRGFRAR